MQGSALQHDRYDARIELPIDFPVSDGVSSQIRALDWARTPLGPIESWSPALRTMVRFLLANRFPLLLWWGPEYVSIYNDAYCPILGAKHPWALGRPVRECWSEIWHILQPLIDRPYHGGPATWNDDICLEINRHGFVEETHFTIAYSPVPDESVPSGIGGVLATVHEITEKVVGQRRVIVLRDLGAHVSEAKTADEACGIAARTLSAHAQDIPFALLYLLDPSRQVARLAGAAGVERGLPISPMQVDLKQIRSAGWPMCEAACSEELQIVESLEERFPFVPQGPWSEAPSAAVLVPIPSNKPHEPAGILVAGLSARLAFDTSYRDFLDLVRSQISAAIANAVAYEQERQRAEALSEIDRAKTAFFSNVSHEFRTPLTLMLGPLDDVLRNAHGELPAGAARDIEVAQRNALRLLKLVNSLLDFSRIEAGRIEASYQPIDLAALTTELASVFRSAIEKAGLRFSVVCPPLPEPVFVDREMWEKIVLNLLSNAFKFTFEGEIAVALRWNGETVELTVSDTGVGIPETELPRVFERFHRIRGTRSRTHEGTGIGLALVQELARLHGGDVRAQSQEGRGSSFTVTIRAGKSHLPSDRIEPPRERAPAAVQAEAFVQDALRWLPADEDANAPTEPPRTQIDPARDRRAPEAPRRILLADDNADMRDYLRRLLSPHFVVDAVADGQAALERALSDPPDLVLADVMMPGLDGFELLSRLRSDDRTRSTPIILLSARAGDESRIEGLQAGADDYLVKPFSARELLARIGSHVELAQVRRAGEAALREREELLRQRETAAKRDAERQRILSEALADLLSSESDKVLRAIFTKVAAHLGVDTYFNYMVGETGDELVLHSAAGISPELAHEIRRLRFGQAICGTVAQQRKPIIATDIQHSDYDKAALVRGLGIQVYACNPLMSADRLIGTLSFASRTRPSFDADELEFMRTIARYVSVAIDRADREQALRESEQRREHLLNAERAARTEAEKHARLKDEFLASVSHELRTPLNGMLGWAQLIQRSRSDGNTIAEGTTAILNSGRLQAQIIDDLLDMNRIISGKLRLNLQSVDPVRFVEEALATVRPGADAKGIRILADLDPAAGPIIGDSSRLQQVAWNLIGNAVKFTPRGGQVRITVKRENSQVELCVSDTGIGIPQEFLPHVFDRFRQADSSTTRRFGGLGLGLAIAKHITELHGGSIDVSSPGPNAGATFRVRLPVAVTRPLDDLRGGAAPRDVPLDPELRGIRILIVDDDPGSCDVLERLLTSMEAETQCVHSGAEALERIADRPPDVLLCDIGMPGLDGLAVIRQARSVGAVFPAIAITAFARTEDRIRSMQAGFNLHLSKPVDTRELVTAIQSLLRSSPAEVRHR